MSKTKKSVHSSEGYSSTTCSSSSPSSDEEIDARDSKPIKDYMGDRRELARQLFKSVKAEKVRMMLPQTLKKVDFNELEELCTSELSGMSKARILSILNGKPMLESSDTSESDDSGPSLEIISDTEEWLTDDDIPKKSEGKIQLIGKTKIKKEKKTKQRPQIEKKNSIDKAKVKLKNNIKEENVQLKESQIKKEGEKDVSKTKEKEGDSLLDLLELEMRARAIRALIRNEEDIIPEQGAKTQPHRKDMVAQEEVKAKESCRRQLEKLITSKSSTAEDEDVVLVVQPTPTIELLSSESDEEGHGTRINQKLQNERVLVTQHGANTSSLQNIHTAKVVSDSHASKDKEISAPPRKNKDRDDDSRSSNTENNKSSSDKRSGILEKKRKLKRKFQSKDAETLTTETPSKVNLTVVSESQPKQHEETSLKAENSTSSSINNETMELKVEEKEKKIGENLDVKTDETAGAAEQSNVLTTSTAKKFIIEDDRSADMDEIIDLDDYSDDMDDLDCDNASKKKSNTLLNKLPETDKDKPPQKPAEENPGSTETWATRYYQTDDVQSVIKESKIQSEIRKRLRERQRLSKMTKSPNVKKSGPSTPPETTVLSPEQKPTGSVEEYLALKRHLPGSSGTDSNDGNVSENTSHLPGKCSSDASKMDLDKTSAKEVELSSSRINQTEATESTNNDMRPD